MEAKQRSLQRFYDQLLAVLRQPVVREGRWRLLECVPAWESNWTSDCFIACSWQGSSNERLLVAVNYAPNQSQCYVRLPYSDLSRTTVRLNDLTSAARFDREGDDLASRGLYLDMPPWGYHVFEVEKLDGAHGAAIT